MLQILIMSTYILKFKNQVFCTIYPLQGLTNNTVGYKTIQILHLKKILTHIHNWVNYSKNYVMTTGKSSKIVIFLKTSRILHYLCYYCQRGWHAAVLVPLWLDWSKYTQGNNLYMRHLSGASHWEGNEGKSML